MQKRMTPVIGDQRFIRTDDAGATHAIWQTKINRDDCKSIIQLTLLEKKLRRDEFEYL